MSLHTPAGIVGAFSAFRDAYDVTEIHQEVHVTSGVGALAANILQVTDSVLIIDQYAEIIEVTALTNLTDVWADLWDGSVSVPLTRGSPGGADFSGLPVGSIFARCHDSSVAYDVINATDCAIFEPSGPKLCNIFVVTQKTGAVPTFLRFRGTAGAPVDFKMDVTFQWAPLDGGTLVFV